MRFEWDESKNRLNRAKHGVSFQSAVQVFDDPIGISKFDRVVESDERWHFLGMTRGGVILVVVHTYVSRGGDEIIRIISARKGNAYDQQSYERGY